MMNTAIMKIRSEMNNIIWVFCLCSFVLSCKNSQPYFPEQHPQVSDHIYEMCTNNLKKAYETNNNYLIAYNIACLKGDKDPVIKNLEIAFKKDSSFCESIYHYQKIAEEGFFESFYRYDTLLFKSFLDKCDQRGGNRTFEAYMAKEQREYDAIKKMQPQLDSSLMDKSLISELTIIQEDDQKYRRLMAAMNVSEFDKKRWEVSRDSLDRVNLKKIVSILNSKGYPQPEVVGYDLSQVPYLVIHHQSSVEVRLKFRPLLAGNISEGLMMMYDRYTNIFIKEKNEGN